MEKTSNNIIGNSQRDNKIRLLNYFSLYENNEFENKDYDHLTYKKGQIIFQLGNTPLGIFIIKRGIVKTFRNVSNGYEHIIRLAGPLEFIGHRELLVDRKYRSTCQVLSDVEMLFIPRSLVFGRINEEKEISQLFIKLFYSDIAIADDKLTDFASKPARERLVDALLILQVMYSDGPLNGNPIRLSRKDLSSYVGVAKGTVIRLLSQLKDDKLIELKGHEIIIKDRQGLKNINRFYL